MVCIRTKDLAEMIRCVVQTLVGSIMGSAPIVCKQDNSENVEESEMQGIYMNIKYIFAS